MADPMNPERREDGLSERTDPVNQGRRARASANPPSGSLAESDSPDHPTDPSNMGEFPRATVRAVTGRDPNPPRQEIEGGVTLEICTHSGCLPEDCGAFQCEYGCRTKSVEYIPAERLVEAEERLDALYASADRLGSRAESAEKRLVDAEAREQQQDSCACRFDSEGDLVGEPCVAHGQVERLLEQRTAALREIEDYGEKYRHRTEHLHSIALIARAALQHPDRKG